MAQGATEPNKGSDVLQVQHQIRANAAELQDYFADLYSWEQKINKEEQARKAVAKPTQSNMPMPRGQKTVSMSADVRAEVAAKRADAHTYDKGYKKWETFDADSALRDDDDNGEVKAAPVAQAESHAAKATQAAKPSQAKTIPPPAPGKSREDIEREEGNEHYKCGDYVAAIKSYTRALGFNSQNVVVLSNRAMAYLKNREYGKAEEDCTLALKIDANHVKSRTRRGTARNSLGKHRLALLDFQRAQALDPKSKQIAGQITSTKELMKTAIKRTSKQTTFSIQVVGESKAAVDDIPAPADKENVSKQANRTIEEIPTASKAPSPAATSPASDEKPAPVKTRTRRPVLETPLPKVPTKVPSSSYEFLRVWKTLVPKGDEERKTKLLQARASYLRLLPAATLPSVFKDSIESEIFCDIFTTVRAALDVQGSDKEFVYDLVYNLPRVPRFSMLVMFLTDAEKADCAWVMEQLLLAKASDTPALEKLQTVKTLYILK